MLLKFQPKHESICKQFYGSQRKRTSPDPDLNDDLDDTEFDSPRVTPPRGKNRNWRKEHEELLNNIKNARRAARAAREGKPMPPPPPPTDHPGVYTKFQCFLAFFYVCELYVYCCVAVYCRIYMY